MSMLGVSMKPKMNCDFALRRLSEAKNELRFAFTRIREAKNEMRFAFPRPREMQKRIAIWLPRVPGDAKTNCDLDSRSIWRRKNEWRLGFAGRRGNPKGIEIPMQCASWVGEISYGKASWSDRDSQKDLRFLCCESSMFER